VASSHVLGSRSEYEPNRGVGLENKRSEESFDDSFPDRISRSSEKLETDRSLYRPFPSRQAFSEKNSAPLVGCLHKQPLARDRTSLPRFLSLWRFKAEGATYIELASLDYATPSGFLNLLTFPSPPALSVLFHTESAFEITLSEASPSQ
jgi:hypothetical protein